jgi:hypothetical protein
MAPFLIERAARSKASPNPVTYVVFCLRAGAWTIAPRGEDQNHRNFFARGRQGQSLNTTHPKNGRKKKSTSVVFPTNLDSQGLVF